MYLSKTYEYERAHSSTCETGLTLCYNSTSITLSNEFRATSPLGSGLHKVIPILLPSHRYSVALVAAERFMAINFPFKHRTLCSNKNLMRMSIGVWLYCGIWLTGEMIVWPYIIEYRQIEPDHYCDHPLYYTTTLNIIHR